MGNFLENPLVEMLIKHEGLRTFPYDDLTGEQVTAGSTIKGKISIGIGRNLTDIGLSHDEAMMLLTNDIERTRNDLTRAIPWWTKLDEVRQAVVLSMAFNLGIDRLLTFVNTLTFIRNGQYDKAADNMLLSLWAKQVGPRAKELSMMLRTGKWAWEDLPNEKRS